MRKILLALALLLAPTLAWGQCTGIYPAQTVCGNSTGSDGFPTPTTYSSFNIFPGTAGYALIGNGGGTPASFQGFLQSGTGAVTRLWNSKAADIINVVDFGADPTGVASSVAAFQAAIDSTTNAKVIKLHVPTGTYLGDMTTLVPGTRAIVWLMDGTVTFSTAHPIGTLVWTTYLGSASRPWIVDDGIVAGVGDGGGFGIGSNPKGSVSNTTAMVPMLRMQLDAQYHCTGTCATNQGMLELQMNVNKNDAVNNDVADGHAMINATISEFRHGATASANQRFVGANIYTKKDVTAIVSAGTGSNDTLFGANFMCEDGTLLAADASTGTCTGVEIDMHASGAEGAAVHRRVMLFLAAQNLGRTTAGDDFAHTAIGLLISPTTISGSDTCASPPGGIAPFTFPCPMVIDSAITIDPGPLGTITTGIDILDGTGTTPHLTTGINIASGATGLQIADNVAGMGTGIYVGTGGIQGPVGGSFSVKSSLPVAATTSTAGNDIALASSNARAGSSVAGAAAGGNVTLTAGDAKRFSSGNAAGGSVTIKGGNPIGTGANGDIKLNTGGTDYFGLSGNGGHVKVFGGTAPALTSCGTNPAISGTDTAGQVTMGTAAPVGCVITFNVAYTNAPWCVVEWQTNLASMQYTTSTAAITLVQTGTSSNKVNYFCLGN